MDFTEPKKFKTNPGQGSARKSRLARDRTSVAYDKELELLYSDPIWFYDNPPDFSISLYEFETYALDRLKLLRIIERLKMTSKTDELFNSQLKQELTKQNLKTFVDLIFPTNNSADQLSARKFDHISHYILRLAYCRTDDLRKWLISSEMALFGIRLAIKGRELTNHLISKYALPINAIADEEKDKLRNELQNGTFHYESVDVTASPFYKVGFTCAMDLVRTRKVFLKAGEAYIPQIHVSSIILSEFRKSFSEALTLTSRLTPVIEEDERLKNLLQDFEKKYTGQDYGSKTGKENGLTTEMLPDLSRKSFPLCMKSLYDVVTNDYHLKHWGRLQLGLFFKGVNLPLEESVKFWRNNFTKKTDIDANRFDKQYLYNIRHMYGKEGKRADYTPYNCMKVIMQNVGPGDSHGCPFRHSDETPLRTKLVAAEIPATGIKEIMDLIEKHHYQIACQKYFEWTHNQATVEGGVMHPNQYFEESQRVLQGKQSVKPAARIPTKRRMVYEDGSTQSYSDQEEKVDSSTENPEKMDVLDSDELDIEMIMSSLDT